MSIDIFVVTRQCDNYYCADCGAGHIVFVSMDEESARDVAVKHDTHFAKVIAVSDATECWNGYKGWT